MRSFLSVLAGYAATVAVVSTTVLVLVFLAFGEMPDPDRALDPPLWMTLAEIALGLPAAMVGGYVCGRLARRAEVRHGLALAGVMVAMSVVSVLVESELGRPLWVNLALMAVAVAGTLAGAWLRGRHRLERG